MRGRPRKDSGRRTRCLRRLQFITRLFRAFREPQRQGSQTILTPCRTFPSEVVPSPRARQKELLPNDSKSARQFSIGAGPARLRQKMPYPDLSNRAQELLPRRLCGWPDKLDEFSNDLRRALTDVRNRRQLQQSPTGRLRGEVKPRGSGLVYATYLGGSGSDTVRGVAVDSSGNIYVVGDTSSAAHSLVRYQGERLQKSFRTVPRRCKTQNSSDCCADHDEHQRFQMVHSKDRGHSSGTQGRGKRKQPGRSWWCVPNRLDIFEDGPDRAPTDNTILHRRHGRGNTVSNARISRRWSILVAAGT